MSAITELASHGHHEEKDEALFVEGKGESAANGHTEEYNEYLRLENEVFVAGSHAKKKLIRKMDIRVVAPLVVSDTCL